MSEMIIALHDSEMDHFGKGTDKFPNYALMKISAYHKAKGDTVEWFQPLFQYDKVYSSKVFEWTPENPYLPEDTIKGGTGYGLYNELPEEIDRMFPDYSIYPECDYAIGFITRGCIRNCRWCVVPKKEGKIHKYRHWSELVRPDSDKLVLMDNNILACKWGVENLRELAGTKYKVDVNQGMDARLVTPEIAAVLAKVKWIKNIRFSCDQKSQIVPVQRAVTLLKENGLSASKVFVYCLLTKDKDDDLERIYAMRECGGISLYGMPEKNPTQNLMPERWQNVMAQKYIYSGQWRKTDWYEWKETHRGYFNE